MNEQNNPTSESANQIPITAYLSYRQRNPQNANALELLDKHCSDQAIQLIYDKEAIHPGESIKKFMDELASARCIFIFLTPDYFESSYTLYELVTIAHWADFDQRFIFPIRVTSDLTAYQVTATRNYWDQTERIRDELARLLGTDHENAWKQVETAWNKIVSSYLDKHNDSLESGDQNAILEKKVNEVFKSIEFVIDEEHELLHQKIKSEVTAILNSGFLSLNRLAREMGFETGVTAEKIVHLWLQKETVEDAIIELTRVVQEKLDEISNLEKKKECHYQAVQIGGWLLINSVDRNWWFNHQLRMKQLSKKSISQVYSLAHPPYIEVIVSRSLLQQAKFRLNDEGHVQSANSGHDLTLLFDGVSPEATEIQLLAPIYKDLHKSDRYPTDLQSLRDQIYNRAKARFNVNRRPIYYLVSTTTLRLFENQSWFPEMSQRIAEYLQFICINHAAESNSQKPYNGNPASLLDQFAVLLSLIK
jgi:hypothetical protein